MLCLVGCSGLSGSAEWIKAMNWTQCAMYEGSGKAYMNLVSLYEEYDDGEEGSSSVVTSLADLLNNGDYTIDSCSDTSDGMRLTMMAAVLFQGPGLVLALLR